MATRRCSIWPSCGITATPSPAPWRESCVGTGAGSRRLRKHRLLDHPDVARPRQISGLHGIVDDDTGDALAADARQGAVGQTVGDLGLVHKALHVVLLPAVALDALVGAGEVDLELAVALDGGGRDVTIPQQEVVGIVPDLEASHKAAHDVLEAVSQSAVAHRLGGGEVKIYDLPLSVPYGLARGDHEEVVTHVDLVVQIAIQHFHVRLGADLRIVILGQTVVVDPVDHVELGIRKGGDSDVVDSDRHGKSHRCLPHAYGQITDKIPRGRIGGHVDADIEGRSARLGLPLVQRTGDLVHVEGSLAGDEVLDGLVVGGAEHFGIAVQRDGGGQKLVDHRLTALHGELGGYGLAALQHVIGQQLEAGIGSSRGVQRGAMGARQLGIGVDPLIFGEYLIFHWRILS